jgi:hypothetical protein
MNRSGDSCRAAFTGRASPARDPLDRRAPARVRNSVRVAATSARMKGDRPCAPHGRVRLPCSPAPRCLGTRRACALPLGEATPPQASPRGGCGPFQVPRVAQTARQDRGRLPGFDRRRGGAHEPGDPTFAFGSSRPSSAATPAHGGCGLARARAAALPAPARAGPGRGDAVERATPRARGSLPACGTEPARSPVGDGERAAVSRTPPPQRLGRHRPAARPGRQRPGAGSAARMGVGSARSRRRRARRNGP